MKLLAIVTDEIKKLLIHTLSCEIVFQRSWQQIDPATVSQYDYVIASGALIEDPREPLAVWGIASALRYFGITAFFVDVSGKTTGTLVKNYPQIKLLSHNGDGSQFILQLRTLVPKLFLDDPKYRNSTLSASANAQRFDARAMSASVNPRAEGRPAGLRKAPVSQITGSRSFGSSELKIPPQPTAVTGSFEPVSSIPLGLKKNSAARSPAPKQFSSPSLSQVPKAKPVPPENDAQDCFDLLDDFSSISSISNISSVPDALDKALSDGEAPKDADAGLSPSQNAPTDRSGRKPSSVPDTQTNIHTIVRSLDAVAVGNIEFGNIINVLQTIHNLGATGVLEIKNETRCVRIEFRQGMPYIMCSPSVVLSALGWTSGEFNFDANKMLSSNAQPIDLRLLFANAAQEQLSLNPLLQALEKKFNSYVVLTDIFDPKNHSENAGMWWRLCDGKTRFSEIMMRSEVAMDIISRDIFLAWLCDEICFLKNPSDVKIRIEYAPGNSRSGFAGRSQQRMQKPKTNDPTAQDIQVRMIRKQLADLRDSFSVQSGYSLLRIQRGCGIKALDAAYYAWINQYHADRFVRYNDHECVKLANELLMLMNSAYAKLAKAERSNPEPPIRRVSEPHLDVSPRIGAGRARISTLNASSESSRRLRAVSDELKAIQANERKQESSPARTPIRPASLQSEKNASDELRSESNNEHSSAQFIKMSDYIARREAAKKAQNDSSPIPEPESSKTNLKHPAKINEQATPEQLFATAQKKLKLGLNQDALEAIQTACSLEPDNVTFSAYRAYATFLVNPETRGDAVKCIATIAKEMRENAKLDTSLRSKLFAPYYFLGKLHIAAEEYEKANEALAFAAKVDPSDIDTQRSLRYIAMQLEKKQTPEAKGFFARIKNKFST